MTKNWKDIVQYGSACALLSAGIGLSVAGFIVPPVGEISDSVLWLFAQCLIYAGSVFGVSIYARTKVSELREEILKTAHQNGKKKD